MVQARNWLKETRIVHSWNSFLEVLFLLKIRGMFSIT